jgi:transcriptional regulator with XRE-family HTH domain
MSSRGARLAEAMERRGMQKQYALAHALGVNESTITRWKKNGPMSLESAIALCRTLDLSLDWFLTGHGSMDQHKSGAGIVPDGDERLWLALHKAAATLTTHSKVLLTDFIGSVVPP